MRIRDVKFPDGSIFVDGSEADIARYGQCLVALGGILSDEDELLKEREPEVLDCLQKYYPGTARRKLRAWFQRAEVYSPEVMELLANLARVRRARN